MADDTAKAANFGRRQARANDFQVDVPDIGAFVFGRRTPRDVFRIRTEYARLTESHYDADGNAADMTAYALATLKVMTVVAPEGYDPEAADAAADDAWETRIVDVWHRLIEKELSFRPRAGAGEPAQGA